MDEEEAAARGGAVLGVEGGTGGVAWASGVGEGGKGASGGEWGGGGEGGREKGGRRVRVRGAEERWRKRFGVLDRDGSGELCFEVCVML